MQYVWMLVVAAVVVLGTLLVVSNQAPVDQQVRITLAEWKISPNPIELRAGPARLIVFNMGTKPHALAIIDRNRTVLRQLETIPPGQIRTFLLALPQGEFLLYDPLFCRDPIRGACEQKTMVSTLIVR
ncbi:MAG: cupredoxin domain-containing protein [Candidatus Bipolaricaulota bacterium]|nr:cupredoxin domain-containing protein [Candidatus Bipolaricaulota bacterium]MDW8030912.1 cupredoxin domain-containing protein [Candidatus Bipolaricaulota bacterium]